MDNVLKNVKYYYGEVVEYCTDAYGKLKFPYSVKCKVPGLISNNAMLLPVHVEHISQHGRSCIFPEINAKVRIKVIDDCYDYAYLDGVIDSIEDPLIETLVNRSPGTVSVTNVLNNNSYDAKDSVRGYEEKVVVGSDTITTKIINGPTYDNMSISVDQVQSRDGEDFASDKLTTHFERIIEVNGTTISITGDAIRISLGESRAEITTNAITLGNHENSIKLDANGIALAGNITLAGNVNIAGGFSMEGMIFPDTTDESNVDAPLIFTRPVSMPNCIQMNSLSRAFDAHAHEFVGAVTRASAPLIIAPPVGGPCTFIAELTVTGVSEGPDTFAQVSQTDITASELAIQNMQNSIAARQQSTSTLEREIEDIDRQHDELDSQIEAIDNQILEIRARRSRT